MNIRTLKGIILAVCLALLTACTSLSGVPSTSSETPVAVEETPGEGTSVPEEGTPSPVETPTGEAGSSLLTLRVWLPPQFAPNAETEAGALLKSRLDEFALLHPGVRITVRVKAETGPGGMVSSLSAMGGAVPGALPDLVLTTKLEMERAVRSRLLQPYPEALEEDWYDFSRSLATINQSIYGRPFATDALVMLYRPAIILDPPRDWTTTLNASEPLLFAGGAPNSLFTLSLYSAAGGRLQDDNLRPFLNEATLTALLNFYRDGLDAGVIASQTNLILDENIVYQNFVDGSADMAVTWVSNYFQNPDDTIAATGLPTVSSRPHTLVKGWLWAISNPDPARQAMAVELSRFLTAPEFISTWTAAAGYLPPRAEALNQWPDSPAAALASRIILSAQPIPPLDVIETTGLALQQAVADLFSGAALPAEAAKTAASRVNTP